MCFAVSCYLRNLQRLLFFVLSHLLFSLAFVLLFLLLFASLTFTTFVSLSLSLLLPSTCTLCYRPQSNEFTYAFYLVIKMLGIFRVWIQRMNEFERQPNKTNQTESEHSVAGCVHARIRSINLHVSTTYTCIYCCRCRCHVRLVEQTTNVKPSVLLQSGYDGLHTYLCIYLWFLVDDAGECEHSFYFHLCVTSFFLFLFFFFFFKVAVVRSTLCHAYFKRMFRGFFFLFCILFVFLLEFSIYGLVW